MEFWFKNKELEKLYTAGKSRKYRLPEDITDRFFARIQQIEAAVVIHDLWNDKGLNIEKLQGYDDRFSIRLNNKYRLEVTIDWLNAEKTIGEFAIVELSIHYA